MPEKNPTDEKLPFERFLYPIKSRAHFPEIDYLPMRKINGLHLEYVGGIANALIHYGTIHPEEGKYILDLSEHHYADYLDSDIVEKGSIGPSSVAVAQEILLDDLGISAEINILSRHRDWRVIQHELERYRSIVIGNKNQAIMLNGLIDSRHESRVIAPSLLTGKSPRRKISLPEVYKVIANRNGVIISVH